MDKKPLWNEDKTNGAMWGAGLVAAALVIGGSFWPGWQLDSTAEKMAVERAQVATVAALAPVCADKFAALPDAEAKKVALLKADSWKRDEYIPKILITLPGETSQSSRLLEACFELIKAPKPSSGAQAQKG